ncbi:hypothetical protein MASR1M68_03220 [Elusimicrobiota bacterium]
MKKLLFFLSLLFFCGVFVYADVPKKLNLQGKLTSDSGQVLAGKSISTAVLHLRPAGSTTPNNAVDTQTDYSTDSNGLYSINFNVTNFNFDSGADFKVVLTVDGQSIPTEWASIATNPYSFYSSTATYARILDPNYTEKLVSGNFYSSSTYRINVTTAVAVSTASYTAGNSYVWGIGTDGVQKWTNPDIQVSTAAYAINAGTATYSNASSYALNSGTAAYSNASAYSINSGTSAYALRISTVPVLADGDAQVWTVTNSGGTIYQSWDTVVSGLKAGDGLRLTGKTISVSAGSGIGFDVSKNLIVPDTAITPAKLQQGGGVLYNVLVSSANNATNASAINASGAGANLFWGYDSGGTVQAWRAPVIAGNGLSLSGTTLTVSTGTGLGFSGASVVVTTAPYALGAGTVLDGAITASKIGTGAVTAIKIATDAVSEIKILNGAVTSDKIGSFAVTEAKISTGAVTSDKIGSGAVIEAKIGNGAVTENKIANGSIIPAHFKYVGTGYDYTYDIKVATAVYAETGGADLAEIYASTELLTPGDVVSIDVTKDNAIVKTKVAEDTLVAGVISTKPGLLMNKTEKGYELALVGKVPTKVCNEGGSIKRGDLLVSASIAGYAKKAGDNPKTGTVIGKALENFDSVNGTILVLVNLQ